MEISLRKSFWLISIRLAGNFHPIGVRNNSELGTDSVINQSELPKKVPDLEFNPSQTKKEKVFSESLIRNISTPPVLHQLSLFFFFLACNEVIRCVIRCKTSSLEVI